MLEKSNIPKKLAKSLSQLGIFLHILSCAFGIIYFSFPVNSFIFDIFGVILIASWFLNILILLIDDSYLNKSTVIGKRINRLTFYNIILFIIGVLYRSVIDFVGRYSYSIHFKWIPFRYSLSHDYHWIFWNRNG